MPHSHHNAAQTPQSARPQKCKQCSKFPQKDPRQKGNMRRQQITKSVLPYSGLKLVLKFVTNRIQLFRPLQFHCSFGQHPPGTGGFARQHRERHGASFCQHRPAEDHTSPRSGQRIVWGYAFNSCWQGRRDLAKDKVTPPCQLKEACCK